MSERDWQHVLVNELVAAANPGSPRRAVLARLRQGLAVQRRNAGRLTYISLTGTEGLFRAVPPRDELAAVLAAGLFAWSCGKSEHVAGRNFGAAFGRNLNRDDKMRREKRLIDLLDTDETELPYKLSQAVSLMAAGGVALDWALLIRHIDNWSHPSRWVQTAWARDFWSAPTTEDAASSEQSPPTTP